MSEEAIVAELRAIRDMMILEGGEQIETLTEGLGGQHVGILEELDTADWTPSSDVLQVVAEAAGVSREAVRQKKDQLLDRRYIEQRGHGQGTEYRKTGLGLAAERTQQLKP